jgi:hypothetical protein
MQHNSNAILLRFGMSELCDFCLTGSAAVLWPASGAPDVVEEVGCADLAAFEHEFESIERAIGVGAAEGTAGLDVGKPGEGVDAKLLHSVRRRISATDQDAADGCGEASCLQQELQEQVPQANAQGVASCRRIGRSE